MIRRNRKTLDAVYDNEGKPICPHCGSHSDFPIRNYGVEDGVFWFRRICSNCDNYAMFYSKNNERIYAVQRLLFGVSSCQ